MKQRQVGNSVFYAQSAITTKEKQDSMSIFLCEHLLSTSSPDEPPLHNGDYSAILCFQTDPPRSSCMQLWMSDCCFTQSILDIHQSGYSTVWNCRCLGANYVYTIQLCTSLQYYLIQSHTGRLHVCLAKTCHLHIWQNDQDLSRAAAVKWRWNRYQNKSQHRKLTVEKKILPLLLPGFEPKTLQSWVFPLFRHMFTHVVTIFNHIQCVTSV